MTLSLSFNNRRHLHDILRTNYRYRLQVFVYADKKVLLPFYSIELM